MTIRLLRRVLLVVATAATAPFVSAQDPGVEVSGVVADSAGTSLPGATAVLLQESDSVLVRFATSHADGVFVLRDVRPGRYLLRITFVGFDPAVRSVEVGDGPVGVGEVRLSPATGGLPELVVKAERVPLVVRRDTVDYDASAFAVRPGSTVEDLLRRMPGVEVEADGTVRAQGEVVQRILVDGKEFFGSDPTAATRNLPADAIDRVQVFDQPSEAEEFTGIDTGDGVRTLNLALKEDRRGGAFGTATGSVGSALDDGIRYDTRGMWNRFGPSTQVSAFASGNNVNRPNLTVEDYIRFMGGLSALSAGSGTIRIGGDLPVGDDAVDGFATSWAGGATARREIDERTTVSANYLGHLTQTDQDREAVRRDVLPAGMTETAELGRSESDLWAHRLDAMAEHKIADGHDVRLEASAWGSDAAVRSGTQQRALDPAGTLASTTAATYGSDRWTLGGSTALTYRRRMGGRRSIVVEAGAELGGTGLNDRLDSEAAFGDASASEDYLQTLDQDDGRSAARVEALYTQALGTQHAVQVRAEHRDNRDTERRALDRVGTAPGLPPALGSDLSKAFVTDHVGATYRYYTDQLRASIGLGVQRSALGISGSAVTSNARWSVLPSASLGVALSETQNLEVRYQADVRDPSVRQFRPVPYARGPLDVYVGNPDLVPERTHRTDLRYSFFDPFTMTTAFAFASVTYTRDALTYARTVDEQLRRTVTPVNGPGAWMAVASASAGTPIRSMGIKADVRADGVATRREELLNGAPNQADVLRGTVEARFQNRDKERYDAQVGLRVTAGTASFSQAPGFGRSYADRTAFGEAAWTMGATTVQTRLQYSVYSGGPSGSRRGVPLWDAELTHEMMGGRARVHLVAVDLLNQNVGVRYEAASSFVEEERISSLGRYFMVKFGYTL